jgi:hypothetical protein
MTTANAIRVLNAYVELGLRDSALRRGLSAASKQLSTFGQTLTGLGTKLAGIGLAASAGLFAATRAWATSGAALLDLSKQTGVSTEALSELGYAAAQTGASHESLATGLRQMAKFLTAAAAGSNEATKALADLGLNAQQLTNLAPDEAFALLGDAINRIPDPLQRASAAMRIFGRSGTELLPMFAEGAAGLAELRDAAAAKGLTVSEDEARAAHALDDALTDVAITARRAVATIGAALAPAIQSLAEAMTNATTQASAWINQHRPLVVLIAEAAPTALALGAALVGLGYTLRTVGTAASIAAAGMTTAAAAIKLGIAAIAIVASSPATLFVGLAAAAVAASTDARAALASIGTAFADVKNTAIRTWQGITAALARGDLTLAAEIAFTGLQLAAAQSFQGLRKSTRGLTNTLSGAWHTTVAALAKAFLHVQNVITAGLDLIRTTFNSVVLAIRTGWAHTIAFLKRLWYNWLWILKPGPAKLGLAATKKELEETLAAIEEERSNLEQAKTARDTQRRQALRDALAEIDRALAEKTAQRDANQAAADKAAEDRINQLRKQLQQKLDQATTQQPEQAQPTPAPRGPTIAPRPHLDLDAIAGGLANVAGGEHSTGTFNPFELAGLGAKVSFERAAQAVLDIAENIDTLARSARTNGPLVFG